MTNIELNKVDNEEKINLLADKAYEVWHEYFPGIISIEQIDYMLDMFLAPQSIKKEIEEGYQFYLLYVEGEVVGFTAVKPESDKLFISKLYVDKAHRGQGYANSMFELIKKIAVNHNLKTMYLTVNKENMNSIELYKHKGFVIVDSVVNDIGNGYVMDDYIFELELTKKDIAMTYFKMGYNCSQSVLLAFAEETGVDKATLSKISSSFGGGMGRLREVCGAVSGMFMVAGMIYGYDDPNDFAKKTEHYSRIQELAAEFRGVNKSIVCRELLGIDGAQQPIPEKRTREYYKKRPCVQLVGDATEIMDKYLKEEL